MKKKKKKKSYSRFEISFLERVCSFSLGFWAIRPSEFVGTRKKVALRSEAYLWVPVLRSFDKLREVGVSFYLKLHFV